MAEDQHWGRLREAEQRVLDFDKPLDLSADPRAALLIISFDSDLIIRSRTSEQSVRIARGSWGCVAGEQLEILRQNSATAGDKEPDDQDETQSEQTDRSAAVWILEYQTDPSGLNHPMGRVAQWISPRTKVCSIMATWLRDSVTVIGVWLHATSDRQRAMAQQLARTVWNVFDLHCSEEEMPSTQTLDHQPESTFQQLSHARLHPEVGVILREVEHRPEFDWTVAGMADRVQISRSSFAAKFKELVGMTPMRHVLECRMQLAVQLMTDPSLRCKQVARLVGYRTEASFNTAFKRWAGISPGEFRRQSSNQMSSTDADNFSYKS